MDVRIREAAVARVRPRESHATLDLSGTNVGLFLKIPSTQTLDIVASAGLDFGVLDLEHSQLSEADAIRLATHAEAIGFPVLARISELDRGGINRLLEAGACGIQLSTVRNAAQVRELLAATRYSPEGSRSISLTHARSRYGKMTMRDYLDAERSHHPIIVAQIETAETDDPLQEIIAAGADVLFIGPSDLAADLSLDEQAIQRRVQEITGAVLASTVALGALGLPDPRIRYRVIGSDLTLMRSCTEVAVATERARLRDAESG